MLIHKICYLPLVTFVNQSCRVIRLQHGKVHRAASCL